MNNQVRNIAPFIDVRFLITSPWWIEREGVIHRGLDISTGISQPVYSILTGQVHSLGYDESQGNWIVIKDPLTGYATRYMHLREKPLLFEGQNILANGFVGMEGTTGESTGIHLHVEMQDLNKFNNVWHWSYNKEDYIDPTEFMGIDNVQGTWWIYNINPPQPTPGIITKRKFPWVLYAQKIRNVNNK